jgi:hypothetical protein
VEPAIKCDIAVFKSDYSKRLIAKLPSQHRIVHTTLRLENCDMPAKLHYTVYSVGENGKRLVGAGCLQEHQWVQLTKAAPKAEEVYAGNSGWGNLIGLPVGDITTQALEIELRFTETGILGHESELSKIAQIDILP